MEEEILFERRGAAGFVTLNRPKALNALTLSMVRGLDSRLVEWGVDPSVGLAVVRGSGERAFCAGGDIRALYEAGRRGDPLVAEFFRDEYRLNRRIKRWNKPYVALVDGLVMGGGVGVSVHGSHRVATERTAFAMPETGIGFFPDVGGSWFLPRLPGETGTWLALTGARLKAADCLAAGIATHFVPAARLDELEAALAGAPDGGIDGVLDRFHENPGPAPLEALRPAIDRCFARDEVEAIETALASEGGDWAAAQLAAMRTKSPTSQKVALRQLRLGRGLDFESCMAMEFRLAMHAWAGHDVYEGVRAAVVDKDGSPRWMPDRLEAVGREVVDSWFDPRERVGG